MTAAILGLLFLAQQNTATISGRVLDSSGAAVRKGAGRIWP